MYLAGEHASVWSFNYFFYNKKMKRILYLSCRAMSKSSAEEEVRNLTEYMLPGDIFAIRVKCYQATDISMMCAMYCVRCSEYAI